MSKTREGNDIAPELCNLRMSVPEKSLCRSCKHVTDLCKSQKKKEHHIDSRAVIYRCDGYELYRL